MRSEPCSRYSHILPHFHFPLLPPTRHLHKDPQILFTGYKVPHPLEYQMLIKVRTRWEAAAT